MPTAGAPPSAVAPPLPASLNVGLKAKIAKLIYHRQTLNGVDADLTEALVRDLNAVVCGPAVYEEKRFEQVDLGPETQELLKRAPEGEDLQRLNRLLLQDAYPSELSRRTAMA